MMWLQTSLRIGQVLLAALITVTPLVYKRYSFYARGSEQAIQRLVKQKTPRDTISVDDNEIKLWWIEEREAGFKYIIDTIKKEGIASGEALITEISGNVSKVGVADGDVTAIGNYVDNEPYYGTTPNAIFYIEYTNGDRDPVTFRDANVNRTRRLASLRRWVDSRLTVRSHYLTSVLAIWFTVVSIYLIV
jgi:hypothetical protein